MEPLNIIKIGGNIIDDAARRQTFLRHLAHLPGAKILVHGGGKLATRLAEQLQIPQQMVEGRRITDAETLKIVTMVYAGLVNKTLVAELQALGADAFGLTGADGNAVQAHKRQGASVDYGFAGDVDAVNTDLLTALLQQNLTLVVAPITHDQKGQLLNTNADTLAQALATALAGTFAVSLVFVFEKSGVLLDAADQASVLSRLNADRYAQLKASGQVYAGMIPKLDNAFAALQAGVQKVVIGQGEDLPQLISGTKGTTIHYA